MKQHSTRPPRQNVRSEGFNQFASMDVLDNYKTVPVIFSQWVANLRMSKPKLLEQLVILNLDWCYPKLSACQVWSTHLSRWFDLRFNSESHWLVWPLTIQVTYRRVERASQQSSIARPIQGSGTAAAVVFGSVVRMFFGMAAQSLFRISVCYERPENHEGFSNHWFMLFTPWWIAQWVACCTPPGILI